MGHFFGEGVACRRDQPGDDVGHDEKRLNVAEESVLLCCE
jgi:hypothetical protein